MEPMQVSGTVEEPFGELRFPCMNVQCNWNEERAKYVYVAMCMYICLE